MKLKACPGSSPVYRASGKYYLPELECSGHGACPRSAIVCLEQDAACLSSCQCEEGWAGANCGYNATTLRTLQATRTTLVQTLVPTVLKVIL